MPLSDTACKNAHKNLKAITGNAFALIDEKGLYILFKPNFTGRSKWWWLKKRFNGKDCLMSLGVYTDASLQQAKERRDNFRKQIAEGINPS
jgi:Arm DNA-binding domain